MSDSRFRRWAAMVGDFGSPFFAEERQRDVWNEASAVGLQVVLWAGLIVSAGAFWIGGPAGLPYGLALMAVVSAGALVTVLYAEHRVIRTLSWQWVSGRRLAVVTLVFLVYLGGLVRAVWEFDDPDHGIRAPAGVVSRVTGCASRGSPPARIPGSASSRGSPAAMSSSR